MLLSQPSPWSWLSRAAGALAGIYVIVRGLDNIENGLSERARDKWKRLFYAPIRSWFSKRLRGYEIVLGILIAIAGVAVFQILIGTSHAAEELFWSLARRMVAGNCHLRSLVCDRSTCQRC